MYLGIYAVGNNLGNSGIKCLSKLNIPQLSELSLSIYITIYVNVKLVMKA